MVDNWGPPFYGASQRGLRNSYQLPQKNYALFTYSIRGVRSPLETPPLHKRVSPKLPIRFLRHQEIHAIQFINSDN